MKAIITIGALIASFAVGAYGFKQYDPEGYHDAELQFSEAAISILVKLGIAHEVTATPNLRVPLHELSKQVEPTVEVVPLEEYSLPFITEEDV